MKTFIPLFVVSFIALVIHIFIDKKFQYKNLLKLIIQAQSFDLSATLEIKDTALVGKVPQMVAAFNSQQLPGQLKAIHVVRQIFFNKLIVMM